MVGVRTTSRQGAFVISDRVGRMSHPVERPGNPGRAAGAANTARTSERPDRPAAPSTDSATPELRPTPRNFGLRA